MLVSIGGTGVSSYARQLQRVQRVISENHALLTDRLLPAPPPAPFGRAGRWLRALVPGPRTARAAQGAIEGAIFFAPDVFRLAQVFFDVHRRPLAVHLPGPPGLMHWTYPVPLTIVGWRNLYTVHDVIPMLHPELTHIDGHRYRRLLGRLARCASAFIAVSETARAEIVQATGCPEPFVINCGLAVDAAPGAAANLPKGLEAGRYVLICGTVEKRKNVTTALAAYRQSKVTLPLVIAGPDGWGAGEIAGRIAGMAGAIRLPYLDDAAMRALIGNARALLMPSLAEGFGLPVAEAMAMGVPVITSNVGALAETAGGAAIGVAPTDVAAMADALRRIAQDDGLHADRRAAGLANAARFTPERFAHQLTQAYATVMATTA